MDARLASYCPGPDNDLSINFFLAKHSHHLLGFPSSKEKTFSQTLAPISCRNCSKYWRIKSASCGDPGLAYTAFSGNPASPGISNLEMANEYISWDPCALFEQRCSFFRHSVMYSVI